MPEGCILHHRETLCPRALLPWLPAIIAPRLRPHIVERPADIRDFLEMPEGPVEPPTLRPPCGSIGEISPADGGHPSAVDPSSVDRHRTAGRHGTDCLPAVAKFALVALTATVLAFGLGHLSRYVPGARAILGTTPTSAQ